jgi:4'-phosphopantetheinyl transferase
MTANSDVPQPLEQLDGHLPPGEVHVWLASLAGQQADAATSLHSLLNADEQERADRFKVEMARDQFVVSRALLRVVLGKYLNSDPRQIAFTVTSHRKPELAIKSDIRFNLSHTDGLTAVGVTRLGRIGIDVERIQRKVNVLELAERFFSRKETDWVRTHSEEERVPIFLACWTAKEAYIKAHGEGLSIPLDGFSCMAESTKRRVRLDVFGNVEESERWSLWRLDVPPEFKGAVAIEAKDCKLRMGQLPPALSFALK